MRTDTLEKLFVNGVRGYRAQVPNQTFATDGLITRVGVMNPNDLQRHLDQLSDQGLRLFRTDEQGQSIAADVSVIDQRNGLTIATPWLETATHDGVRIAWLAGTDPGAVHAPQGWAKDVTESFIRYDPEETQELLFAHGTTPQLMSIIDPATGEVAFAPEVQPSYGVMMARAADAFEGCHYREANDLLETALQIRVLQPEDRVLSARIKHAYALDSTFVDEIDAFWHSVARAWEEAIRINDTDSSAWIGAWAYALTRCGELARAREVLSTGAPPHSSDPWRLLAELNIAQGVGSDPHSIAEHLEDLYQELIFGDTTTAPDPVMKQAVLEAIDHYELSQAPKGEGTAPAAKKIPVKRSAGRRTNPHTEQDSDNVG